MKTCDPPEACATHGRCWEHSDWFLCQCGDQIESGRRGLGVCINCKRIVNFNGDKK